MKTIEKLHNSIDFNDLTCHWKAHYTANVDFNIFIDAATLFNKIKFKIIKLVDAKKVKGNLNQNLINIRKERKKSDKQQNETKKYYKFLRSFRRCHQIFKYCSSMVFNTGHHATPINSLTSINS